VHLLRKKRLGDALKSGNDAFERKIILVFITSLFTPASAAN
jgi:hypothetical protein